MHTSAHGLAVQMHLGVDVTEAPQPHDGTAFDVRGLLPLTLLQLAQLIWGAVCNAICRTTNGAASNLSVFA